MKLQIIDTGYHATPNPQNDHVHRWVTRVDQSYYLQEPFASYGFNLQAGGTTLSPAELLRFEIDDDTYRVVYNSYYGEWQPWPRDNRWHTYPIWTHTSDPYRPQRPYEMRMIGRLRFRIVEPVYDHWQDTVLRRMRELEQMAIDDPTLTVRDVIDDILMVKRELLLARLGQQ